MSVFQGMKNKGITLDYTLPGEPSDEVKSVVASIRLDQRLYALQLKRFFLGSIGSSYARLGDFAKASLYLNADAFKDAQIAWFGEIWNGRTSCDEINVVQQSHYGETLCNFVMLRLLDAAPFKVNFFCCHRMAEVVEKCFPGIRVVVCDFSDYKREVCRIVAGSSNPTTALIPAHHALARHLSFTKIPYPIVTPLSCDIEEYKALFAPQEIAAIKIALCWKCGLKDSPRSFCASDLEPLLSIKNAKFISLQKGEPSGEVYRTAIAERLISNQKEVDRMTSFYSTLLVAKFADVLITCDTSVAHLAGISGVPCLLLLGPNHDQRWGAHYLYPPYPSVRILRKSGGCSWRLFMEGLARDLAVHFL